MFGFGKKKAPSPPLPWWKKGLKFLWLCTRIVLWCVGIMITGSIMSIYLPNGLFGGVEMELLKEDAHDWMTFFYIMAAPLGLLVVVCIPFVLFFSGFNHRASSMRRRRRV